MKARFTDEQTMAMIKEQEAGENTADACRRHGISSATFYKYKSKYCGMKPSDAKRLRSLDRLSAGRSVTETAYDVGFETPSAFIHAFRLLMGKTPRQFMSGR